MIERRSDSHPETSSIRLPKGVGAGPARRTPRHGAPATAALAIALVAVTLLTGACDDRRPEPPPLPAGTNASAGPSAARGEPDGAASAPVNPPATPAERFTVPSKTGTFWVQWTADPWPIPVSDPFALDVALFADAACTQPLALPAAGVPLSVDAGMPHHGHGMNVKPKVERSDVAGAARFRVTGMLFHMPGRWELMFDLRREGLLERAQTTVHLNPTPTR